MQNDRLTELLNIEKSDNQDPMIKYMIALEYKKNENLLCQCYFDILLNDFESYLATYYIAGEYYYNKEDFNKSKEILTKGLEVAKKAENQKTYLEIQNLLMNVEFELD